MAECATPKTLLWHKDYFEVKEFGKDQMQAGSPKPPPFSFFLKAGDETPHMDAAFLILGGEKQSCHRDGAWRQKEI